MSVLDVIKNNSRTDWIRKKIDERRRPDGDAIVSDSHGADAGDIVGDTTGATTGDTSVTNQVNRNTDSKSSTSSGCSFVRGVLGPAPGDDPAFAEDATQAERRGIVEDWERWDRVNSRNTPYMGGLLHANRVDQCEIDQHSTAH